MPAQQPAPEMAQPGRKLLFTGGIPMKRTLGYLGVLLVLTLATTFLAERGGDRAEGRRQAMRARTLAVVLDQVASESGRCDFSRLSPILQVAVQSGDIEAGAVLDTEGVAVVHTDGTRVGAAVDPREGATGENSASSALARSLFGRSAGRVFITPLLGPAGTYGRVVLLLPEPPSLPVVPRALWFFVPAGFFLIALVGIFQSAARWANQPTIALLERLTDSLEHKKTEVDPRIPRRESDRVIQEAVARIRTLSDAKEDLTFKNCLLTYERKRYDAILQAIPDGLIAADSMGKVVLVNAAAQRLLGLGNEQRTGRELGELGPVLSEALPRADRTGQAGFAISGAGGERQILLSRIALPVAEDRTAGTLYLLRDVTAQQAARQAQAEFLSQISHELKAPLNTILAYVDALADEAILTQEERGQYCNTLSAEAARMGQLIGNLLQLSRIQLGDLSARCGYVKADKLVLEQGQAMRAQAEAKGLTLDMKVAENLPPMRGDKDLLAVAVTNLISNAVKYTPRGGRVTLRAKAADDGVCLEVEDTGVGIPEEARSMVFERFYRSEQQEVQAEKGTGLGLSLVREIVEVHDGRINLRSELGKGSCFSLWFPSLEAGTRLNVAQV